MTTKRDGQTTKAGGPAFPQFEVVAGDRDGHGDAIEAYTCATGGMSLRDWFAGQALPALLMNGGTAMQTAKEAYECADAMLTARDRA
jgi:hypothetical protein